MGKKLNYRLATNTHNPDAVGLESIQSEKREKKAKLLI
jgi:hypothetical protein